MPRDLRTFVDESIRVLEREAPVSYAGFVGALRGRRLLVSGEGEPFALAFGSRTVAIVRADDAEDLRLDVDRRTILALVDAELTLEGALRLERLTVRGHITNVADLFDALTAYLRGAVRSPSFSTLLSDFRSSCAAVPREVRHEPDQAPACS